MYYLVLGDLWVLRFISDLRSLSLCLAALVMK